MSSVNPICSPVFNPSPRLRTLLGEARPGGEEADRSAWSHATEQLLPPRSPAGGPAEGGDDIAPLWLIEPRDPGLRGKLGQPADAQPLAQARGAPGPWLQCLLSNDGSLHCLYVTSSHSTSADGFYLPNGGLLIARPSERFRVSRTGVLAGDRLSHRLPSPLEVWRHRLFARTVAAPSNGLRSGRGDLEGAVAILPAERWGPLRPWPPSSASAGAAWDHHALGFYALLLAIAAALNVLLGIVAALNPDSAPTTDFVAAGSLLTVAAGVMYVVRPGLESRQCSGNVLLSLGRHGTHVTALLALIAQIVLRPDESFFWLYTLPLAALLAAGPRRAVRWLILLSLSAAQYGVMTIAGKSP